MRRARWETGPGGLGIPTILVIVTGLIMAGPIVSTTLAPPARTGAGSFAPSPLVSSGKSCEVGSSPEYAAFDPVSHDVYVPNRDSGNLSILNGACKVVATVTFPSGAAPFGAGFNPS
jgi:hypothetical protein